MTGSRQVSAERVIPAPPERIFDLVADPAMHPVIDGSGTVTASHGGSPTRLTLGAEFGMSMRIGVRYRLTNRVVELSEGRRIAWSHIGGARWRYELEPVDGGTRVRETFDWSDTVPLLPVFLRLAGFPRRNRAAMARTLERLERLATVEPGHRLDVERVREGVDQGDGGEAVPGTGQQGGVAGQ